MHTADISAKTTRKRRLIDSLAALSAEEKQTATGFFSRHPNYENLIDWNNRNLTYGDFKAVFARAGQSKAARKRAPKEDVPALFEGQNCVIIDCTEAYVLAAPLDWECAVYFSSSACGGERGKWCIGWGNDRKHWDRYSRKASLFFVYFLRKHPAMGKKLVIMHYAGTNDWFFFRQENKPFRLLPLLAAGLSKNKVQNPFNVCQELWHERLRFQKTHSGQLYFDFDLTPCPQTAGETIPGAAFIKKALPLLLHDGIKLPEYKTRAAEDSKERDFLYELTGELSKSHLRLKYALFLRHHGYEYRIDQKGNIFFFVDEHEYFIDMQCADPQFSAFHESLGDGYCERKDFNSAIKEYSQAIALNPNESSHYYSRALTYADLDNHDMAIADYTQAIRLIFDRRGRNYAVQGRLDKAIADFTQAFGFHPYFWIYIQRGECYYRKGRCDEAIKDYTEAIRLNPDDEKAKKMMKDLQEAV